MAGVAVMVSLRGLGLGRSTEAKHTRYGQAQTGVNMPQARRMSAGRAQAGDKPSLRDMQHAVAPVADNRILHWKYPSFELGAHEGRFPVPQVAGLPPRVEGRGRPLSESAKATATPFPRLAGGSEEQCALLNAGKPSRARFHPGSPVMRNQW